MMKNDAPKLQRFLRKTFNNDGVRVVPHAKKNDMAEVFIGDEFIAPLYREEEDGEVSYQFQMAILDIDLDDA
ncbi:MAG: DUF3126 family protein [Pseudomonadota bacterium]